MDDEQPATPSFRVLRQTNPYEVVYDHLHGSIGGWTSRRTNSYEMLDECGLTNYFPFTPHHPPLFSLLLSPLLLITLLLTTYSFPPYYLFLSPLLLITSLLTTYFFPPYYSFS